MGSIVLCMVSNGSFKGNIIYEIFECKRRGVLYGCIE